MATEIISTWLLYIKGVDKILESEVLNYAIKMGIIDVIDVQEKINMAKREEIIKKHPYRIWQHTDGYWRTYLFDSSKPKSRKLIKKKNLDKIYSEIVRDAEEKESDLSSKLTFRKCFFSMLEVRSEIISENTVDKYEKDFIRFFEGTWIENCDMKDINSENLNTFIVKRIKDLSLRKKAMKALYSYITSTFMSALVNKKIESNPCMFLPQAKFYAQYCIVPMCDAETRIVTKEQMLNLKQQFEIDYKFKPNYIPTYAVELASLTGMRVGEIAALRWDAITDSLIIIDKEEIHNRKTNEFTVANYTKNRKPRVIPMTKDILDHLNRIKEVEKMFGYFGEYVFMNDKGRVNKRTISDCARNKSLQCGIDVKSIHALRRTVNSTLKCEGVSSTVAASMIGNTERVNDDYYTYDVSDLTYKREMLEKVNRKMIGK